MSLMKAMNAVIALLENRPAVAKEIFRAPESDVKDIGDLELKLEVAVNHRVAKEISESLMATLRLEPPKAYDSRDREVFYEGVRAVEQVFENLVQELQ